MNGGSLDTMIRDKKEQILKYNIAKGPLYYFPEKLIWRFALQALVGVEYIHRNGITNGDIKSGNLFLHFPNDVKDLANAELKLGDFNMSKHLEKYASNQKSAFQAFDVFALGAALYELTTLKMMFPVRNAHHIMEALRKGEEYAPIPSHFSPELH